MASKPKKRPPKSDRGFAVSQYEPIPWMATPGMYIAGRAALDEAEAEAARRLRHAIESAEAHAREVAYTEGREVGRRWRASHCRRTGRRNRRW